MTTSRIRAATALLALGAPLVLAIRPAAGATPAEFTNWFNPLPAFPSDTFTVILKGDQTGVIPAQNAADTLTNPFAFNLAQTPTVTVSLDAQGNTDIVYRGAAISPGASFPYPNNEPHFGLNNGVQPPTGFLVLSKTWSNSGVPADVQKVPALSFATVPANPAGPTYNFLIFYAQAGTSGEWFEVPYQPGQIPQVDLSNGTTDPLTLSNVGFLTSPTQIPLDQLNFDTLPPPGSPGSQFTPLPSLDGMTLAPGSSTTALPEPSSLALAGFGALGLLAGSRRRRRSPVAASS